MSEKKNRKSLLKIIGESQVWKSIFRSGVPITRRQRMYAVLGNVFLHLHPARLPRHAVKIGYTWCMGGLSFFLFVVFVIYNLLQLLNILSIKGPLVIRNFKTIIIHRIMTPRNLNCTIYLIGAIHAIIINRCW